MDMDKASMFLAGSILISLGLIVAVGAVIVINNLLSKFWKPVTIVKWTDPEPSRFLTPEEAAKIAQSQNTK